MKKCKKCGEEKEDWEFEGSISKTTGRQTIRSCCRNCERKRLRKYQRENPRRKILRWHGIDEMGYELMLKTQNGVCAICKQSETTKDPNGGIRRLAVDHNHLTGKIRSLLCHKCNVGLGNFNDDPELLRKAAEYLEKHNET